MSATENKAVFLSYASQDAQAAKCICEALRAAGVEVWFDQSELVGGDAWDAKIRGQIGSCALFVPVISAATQARLEGYFRLEWKLAAQRTHTMADEKTFLLPVVIDDTRDAEAKAPAEFKAVQWTRLPSGETSPAFCARVTQLLGDGTGVSPVSDHPGRDARATPAALPGRRSHGRWIIPAGAVGSVAIVLSFWAPWRKTEGARGAPAKALSKPASEAAQLAENAFAITQRLGFTRDDLTVAENLAHRATDLEPGFARAWGVRAWVAAAYINRTWDRSQKRREETQVLANRALTLNPEEPEALNAIARVLITQGAHAGAETMARRAITADPDNYRSRLLLAVALANQQRAEESKNVLLEALRRDPTNVLVRYDLANHYFTTAGDRAQNNAAALEQLDAILATRPFASAYVVKSRLMVTWKGDLVAMREALDGLERMPMTERAEDRSVHAAAWGALLERKPQRVLEATALTARDYFEDGQIGGPKAWLAALAHRIAGQEALERAAWQRAEDVLRQRLRATPGEGPDTTRLAATLAWQGKSTEAQHLIAPLEATLRETRNPGLAMAVARYYGALGDAAGAARHLKSALNQTIFATVPCLRLDPWWDKLRGQPEFEALLVEERVGSAAPADAKSIAVLAFRQLSADPENEYLCEAISDELCSVLGGVPGLRVTASASAFSFKRDHRLRLREIAAQLGVAYLVDGTVQKVGNRVRVRAQLIKGADETDVWRSGNLDLELKDAFAVQDAVVRAIAENLQLRLAAATPATRAINSEAYRWYYEGRRAWSLRPSTDQVARAQEYFQKAIARDPSLGRAYAGLVDVNLELAVLTDSNADGFGDIACFGQRNSAQLASILALADKAVQLEPDSAEAHTARGRVCWYGWQFGEAEREVRLALKLNPSYADAHLVLARLLHADGRVGEALGMIQQAAKLDPLVSRYFDNMGLLLRDAGRYTDAVAAADRALALQPDSIQAGWIKAVALSALGRHEEAVAIARRPEQARGANSVLVLLHAGFKADAIKSSETLSGSIAARAAVFAALGRFEDALGILTGDSSSALAFGYLLYRRELDPLRSDPRFARYLEQIGMTEAHTRAQAWRAAHPPERPETRK